MRTELEPRPRALACQARALRRPWEARDLPNANRWRHWPYQAGALYAYTSGGSLNTINGTTKVNFNTGVGFDPTPVEWLPLVWGYGAGKPYIALRRGTTQELLTTDARRLWTSHVCYQRDSKVNFQ